MKELTEKQKDILIYCYRFHLQNHNFPSSESVRDAFGYSSKNAAVTHLEALLKKGWLERADEVHQGRGNKWKFK